MMSDHEVTDLVRRYSLRRNLDESAPEEYRHSAYFVEVPGCMAQAASDAAAIAELDTLIVPFLRGILEDGGKLPVPLIDRHLTTQIAVGPIFVGAPEDFSKPRSEEPTETDLEFDPGFDRGELEKVA